MKHFDVWAVAAAVLVEAGRTMHYDDIAKRVMETGLTRLGFKGETPAQTIGAEMRKHKDIFLSRARGNYEIARTTVGQIPEVAKALNAMRQRPSNGESLSEVDQLKDRIKALESRNALLQEKITYILKICESVPGSIS